VTDSKMLISVVVPLFNEEGNLRALHRQVADALSEEQLEFIFVDDGSSDSSVDVIESLAAADPRVRLVSFSRNFGHQAALRAGMRAATGEAVISMDADLQHPPALLPMLVSRWREGYQVVYTVRDDAAGNVGLGKRVTSKAFYGLLNRLSDLDISPGAADFRLLDRLVVDELNGHNEADLFLRGYIQWIGFRQIAVPYVPDERYSGASKYSLRKMVRFALSGITQFSVRPLRLGYLLALGAFAFAAAYTVYAVAMAAAGDTIPGWLSIVALISVFQGVQFLLIGLIGEYLGRTFMQTKGRPEYVVARRL